MRVKIDGVEWQIKFYYDTVERFGGERRWAKCEVIDPEGSVFAGEAICNPKDQYSRVGARRESLRRAIEPFDRPFRRKIWDAYFHKVLEDRKKGVRERWGLEQDSDWSLVVGMYDAATGGIRD
jgi:hypothetical protein